MNATNGTKGDLKHYVIRGGVRGRERLKLLSRVMHESTAMLFDRAGIAEGMVCLDVGCGSGDVTLELARRVGPTGRAVGADIDSTKLDLCREEARSLLLKQRGFTDVKVNVTQPVGCKGEVKMLNALTMENIADAVLEDQSATREEIDEIVRELYEYAADPMTIAGAPRIVQAWGTKAR